MIPFERLQIPKLVENNMDKKFLRFSSQEGSVLLESLVAILVFSVGILSLVSMQAFAVASASEAKYRSEATMLANELIGRMWVSDRTQATLQTAFSSPDGSAYKAWAWVGSADGDAGTKTNPTAGTVLQLLPGSASKLPTVAVAPDTSTTPASSVVTITVYWKAPKDATEHKYVVKSQIGG